ANQLDLYMFAAELAGLVDLLLRRRDRHENHPGHIEMAAHEGNALRVIARAGTDKGLPAALRAQHLAHGVERAPDLVGAHRRKVLSFQPDISVEPLGKMRIAQKWRLEKDLSHGLLCQTGGVVEFGHGLMSFA